MNQIFINGEDHTAKVNNFTTAVGLDQIAHNRCSQLIITQLYCRSCISEDINPFKVLAEIKSLEAGDDNSRMKDATQFKHPPLKGLWHKHHLSEGIRSMAINLQHGLRKYGIPHIERLLKETELSGEDRHLSADDIKTIADDAVHGNYARRAEAAELTGDWIVFSRHEGKNYYLCLASHETGDSQIRQQIDSICAHEFPFLKSVLV